MYFIIFGIPTSILYDCGVYFTTYLKGASDSSVFTIELIHDALQILIFYTRISVQGVRLLMMMGIFGACHEFVMFFTIPQKAFISSEYF